MDNILYKCYPLLSFAMKNSTCRICRFQPASQVSLSGDVGCECRKKGWQRTWDGGQGGEGQYLALVQPLPSLLLDKRINPSEKPTPLSSQMTAPIDGILLKGNPSLFVAVFSSDLIRRLSAAHADTVRSVQDRTRSSELSFYH